MSERLLDLQSFQASASATASIRAGAERLGTQLTLRYRLRPESPGAWQVPSATSQPTRRDRLWQHTCLEAFVAPASAAAYWEINLAPTGDWNVYRFDGPRSGMLTERRAERPTLQRSGDAEAAPITITATLDLAPIHELCAASLHVGLAAVIERVDGTLSHWALRHRGPQPDFHDRESFLVRLAMTAEARP